MKFAGFSVLVLFCWLSHWVAVPSAVASELLLPVQMFRGGGHGAEVGAPVVRWWSGRAVLVAGDFRDWLPWGKERGRVRAMAPRVAEGEEVFVCADDPRPVVAVMIGEDEYRTWESLPAYAEKELSASFRLRYVVETPEKSGDFSGMAALAEARVLLISVRRRALPRDQLQAVRDFVGRGGAVVGIRTSSHAFALRPGVAVPEGRAVWPEWDEQVLGGNYQGHHGNDVPTTAEAVPGTRHPVLEGVPEGSFPTGSGLYINTPLRAGTTPLLIGRSRGTERPEPVAWVHRTAAGGRVVYTSLGHVDDFRRPEFRRLLGNAVRWAAAGPSH